MTSKTASKASAKTQPTWQIVAVREIAVKLRDRNFLISIGVTLAIIIASFAVQAWLMGRTTTTTVAFTQSQSAQAKSLIQAAEKTAKADGEHVQFEIKQVADEAAAKALVADEQADVYLSKNDKGWSLLGKKSVDGTFEKFVGVAAQQQGLAANAAAAKVDLTKLTAGTSVQTSTLEGDDENRGIATVVGLVFTFLFYFATILFGMPISQSVVEEKQSRIVEILASAMPLRQLLAGKILGNAALAIGQLVLIVGVALIALSRTKWSSAVGQVATASGWFVVFFIAGFLVIACLMAVAGALASRSEDIQSTAQPVMMIIMGAFVIGMAASGTVLKVASYIPVISSVAMPKRLATGEAQWWEALIALVIAVAAAAAVTQFATKLYTRSVMHTGGRMSYRDALKAQA